MGAERASYERRKANLKKKANELSVLCGIPVCLIVHRIEVDGTATFDTWPPDRQSVLAVIDIYRQRQASEVVRPAKRQRTSSPSHRRPDLLPASSEDHNIRSQMLPRLLSLSEEERDHLGGVLGHKIEDASQTIHLKKKRPRDVAEHDECQELALVTSQPSNAADTDDVNRLLDSDLDDEDGLLSNILALDWDHIPTLQELTSDFLNDSPAPVPLSVVEVGDQQQLDHASLMASSSTSATATLDGTYLGKAYFELYAKYLEAPAVDESAAEQYFIDSLASSSLSGVDFHEYGMPADATTSSYFSVPGENDYVYGFQEMGDFDQALGSYYG